MAAQITHAIIRTGSVNLLQKVVSEMGCPDCHTAMHSLRLQRLLWIYCPGQAGVSGNERADRLASSADIRSGLQLGRAEVLWGLRDFLNMDRPEHYSTDCLKERGVEKGSGQHSTLQGWEWSVFNKTNTGNVSRAALWRLLRDGADRILAFPSATISDTVLFGKLTCSISGTVPVSELPRFIRDTLHFSDALFHQWYCPI